MSRLVAGKKSKMGRPRVDTEEITARVDRATLDGLDAWVATQDSPKATRAEAVRVALRDWLTGLGLLKTPNDREDRH